MVNELKKKINIVLDTIEGAGITTSPASVARKLVSSQAWARDAALTKVASLLQERHDVIVAAVLYGRIVAAVKEARRSFGWAIAAHRANVKAAEARLCKAARKGDYGAIIAAAEWLREITHELDQFY